MRIAGCSPHAAHSAPLRPRSNSPGGVNFESAPFKLTRELLEVMDSDSEGRASELFDYFKVGFEMVILKKNNWQWLMMGVG